jgi:hypothetical protein
MPLEVLHFTLVLLCLLPGREHPKVALLPSGRFLFSGIQPELAAFQFSNPGINLW